MQVAPGPPVSATVSAKHAHQTPLPTAVIALLWLWFNLGISIYYLTLFAPYFANDFLWPQYNTSGYQTYFIDCINTLLESPLLNNTNLSSIAIAQDYSVLLPVAQVHPAYPMSLATTTLTTIEYAITNLRNTTPSELIWLPTMYCWVDFTKQWELAHTPTRQQRCHQKYASNGAMYLESIFRNTNWIIFQNSSYHSLWDKTIFQTLNASNKGQSWLVNTIKANTTVAEEVEYWHAMELVMFQLQWQDSTFPSIDETIGVTNAMGITMTVVVKSTLLRHGLSGSTVFSPNFGFDLWIVGHTCNKSLIRNSAQYVINQTCAGKDVSSFEIFSSLDDGNGNYYNQLALLRQSLGPFLSVDIWVVPVPNDLNELVTSSISNFYSTLETNATLAEHFATMFPIVVAPVPPAWSTEEYFYYGGSPICSYGDPQDFVQQSFSFDESCETQATLAIELTPLAMVFAYSMINESATITSICELQNSDYCNPALTSAKVHKFQPLTPFQLSVNVSVMQFASDMDQINWTLLVQPLLEPSPWSFFGWTMLFDWAQGLREVISMEGDNGTLVLISEAFSTESMALGKSTLSHASRIVFYILVYFSVILVVLGVVCTFASYRCQLENLMFFNRIAGSTWAGRPLMLLRGAAAIVLLSSSPIHLNYTSSITRIELSRRPFLEIALLSYEATWLSVVVHELLVPFAARGAQKAGFIGVCLSWIACVALDSYSPIVVTTQLHRKCTSVDFILHLYCDSGMVYTGSKARLVLLLAIQSIGMPLIAVIFCLFSTQMEWKVENMTMSGSGRAFLLPPMDRLAGILSGVLPWTKHRVFDINLWCIVDLRTKKTLLSTATQKKQWHAKPIRRTKVLFGTAYIVAAISGSFSYLQIIRVKLANDLVWTTFNISGVHAFLSTWFLERVPSSTQAQTYLLNDTLVNSVGSYNLTNSFVNFSRNIGARIQYTTLTSIPSAIVALRNLDACESPWLSTQYCYLDFQKKWEMANSARRQQRCNAMVSNAAVFVEALLRNIEWDVFMHCWSNAFEIGFGHELRSSLAGISFLESVQTTSSISDEINYWHQANLTSYTLQWQNYKYIGIVSRYVIKNAYGASYSFTFAATRGSYRFHDQTSLKMYWGFANDMLSILDNSTLVSGKSLLRSSSNFAFANTTLQDVYLKSTRLLPSPLSSNHIALTNFLGPFGSIDMIYIAVPDAVKDATSHFLDYIQTVRRLDPALYYAIANDRSIGPTPTAWIHDNFLSSGGSVLCPSQREDFQNPIIWGPDPSFSFDFNCDSSALYPSIAITSDAVLFASIFSNLTTDTNTTALCSKSRYTMKTCLTITNSSRILLHKHSPIAIYTAKAAQLYEAMYSLNIKWMEFGRARKSAPVTIYHTLLLNATDTSFDFFGWFMLYDWIIGNSEVISFQGDNAQLNLLGNTMAIAKQPVDPSQLPTVFALFAQRGVQYVTYMMILLAFLTFVYICFSRGQVEGLNMFELSRVGGIVWIGRPLVLLRSLTALCLLSTGSMDLKTENGINYFTKLYEPWYQTCLAANEVTWLVGIVNDICIVFTKELTLYYATINSLIVWIISACLAIFVPVEPTITVNPACTIHTLDYQVLCSMGSIEIGSAHRLILLSCIVILCNFLCFVVVRLCWQKFHNHASTSLLLSGGARYLFQQQAWTSDHVYYLDTASAVLNGLLSCRHNKKWLVFDIKTWRVYTFESCEDDAHYSTAIFPDALPLNN